VSEGTSRHPRTYLAAAAVHPRSSRMSATPAGPMVKETYYTGKRDLLLQTLPGGADPYAQCCAPAPLPVLFAH